MTPVKLVKQHPIATGVGALVVFGAVLLFMNRDGETEDGSAVLPAYAPSYADNSAYQVAQLAASTKMAEIDASRELGLATLATQQTIAGYERDVAFNANEIAGSVKIKDITEANNTQRLVSTLQAQTVQAGYAAETQRYAASQATLQRQNELAYAGIVEGYKAQQSIASTNANALIESQRIAKQPSGLLSFLFG